MAFPLLSIFINYIFLNELIGVVNEQLPNNVLLGLFQLLGAAILLLTVSILSYINAKEMGEATTS